MATVKELLQQGRALLAACSDTARLDAEVLLAKVVNKDRTWLMTWPDQILSDEFTETYHSLLARRSEGEPVAYILGQQAFWSLDLAVSAATLIPRPETELLVETVLAIAGCRDNVSLLDLGTGSGAIALALATEKPGWQITACDISAEAIQIARQNCSRHGLTVELLESDWFTALSDRSFDFIVSNPPYIENNDPHLQQGDVRYEPAAALVSGEDGLEDIRIIARQSREHLHDHGWLLVEHGFQQGVSVGDIFNRHGYVKVQTLPDLSGHDHVTLGRKV